MESLDLYVTAHSIEYGALQPVSSHAMFKAALRTRELYASLLAAVLLSGDSISRQQNHVFCLLLQSIKLEPVAERFFNMAKKIDAIKLKQLIGALKKQDQQCALLLDALILARLDSPLNRLQAELITQLWSSFNLHTETLKRISSVSAMGLGLPYNPAVLLQLPAMSERLSLSNPVTAPVWTQEWLKYAAPTGVWIDPRTGLMWSRISLGQQWQNGAATGRATAESLSVLKRECKNFLLAGFEDWRLPTKEELQPIKIEFKQGYSVPKGLFCPPDPIQPDKYGAYWSYLSALECSSDAWYVNFDVGQSIAINQHGCAYGRLVRGSMRETDSIKAEEGCVSDISLINQEF